MCVGGIVRGGGLCVVLCAGRLGAELVVFSGERIGGGAISSAP